MDRQLDAAGVSTRDMRPLPCLGGAGVERAGDQDATRGAACLPWQRDDGAPRVGLCHQSAGCRSERRHRSAEAGERAEVELGRQIPGPQLAGRAVGDEQEVFVRGQRSGPGRGQAFGRGDEAAVRVEAEDLASGVVRDPQTTGGVDRDEARRRDLRMRRGGRVPRAIWRAPGREAKQAPRARVGDVDTAVAVGREIDWCSEALPDRVDLERRQAEDLDAGVAAVGHEQARARDDKPTWAIEAEAGHEDARAAQRVEDEHPVAVGVGHEGAAVAIHGEAGRVRVPRRWQLDLAACRSSGDAGQAERSAGLRHQPRGAGALPARAVAEHRVRGCHRLLHIEVVADVATRLVFDPELERVLLDQGLVETEEVDWAGPCRHQWVRVGPVAELSPAELSEDSRR